MSVEKLIVDHMETWTSALQTRSTAGRGSSGKIDLYGIKKLRELILELAVRGKLVPQDPNDEPASELLKRIAAEKAELVKQGKIKKQKPLPEISEEEKPFELPDGWEWTTLTRIAEINPKIDVSDDEQEISFIPMPLISTKFDGSHEFEIKKWKDVKKGYTHFANGDIAIAKITPCFENSKAAIFSGLKNGIGVGTTELHVARPFSDIINRKYLLLNFKSPNFLKSGESQMTGSAGQKRVPRFFFENNPIPFPPLQEQERIIIRFTQLMSLCDQLEQQSLTSLDAHQQLVETLLGTLTDSQNVEELAENWARISEHFDTLFTTEASVDALKQTILQLAVMGKLVPQDPNDEPASELLKRIAQEKAQLVKEGKIKKQKPLPPISDEEKPFELPEGWEWCRLGSIYNFLNGYAFKSEWFTSVGLRLLRNANIAHGVTNWKDVVHIPNDMISDFENYILSENDIVISLDRPIINTGLKYAIISKSDLPCLLLQRVAKFKNYANTVSNSFLTIWLQSYFFINSIDPGRSNGVPHISTKQLEMTLFPLLPQSEQDRIISKMDELIQTCNKLKYIIKTAKQTQLHLADALTDAAIN
ncbi:restriction endonuclease subunit S [Escherichia coli]|uniref:Type I restriction enzyme EcoAI specificity subunit n=1 Tax=Escherichia coli TaxID=562 RepID=T1SA_ECOLX|nr:restriction endonuclease subunit S [Escherichia coli]P19704.2 RecName: Full=Type I restriction enzyme EcoAI specificity subunit; Short=S protein; AltName: Full=Type I specificity subunit S.EcoAI; Short=S.EcoAI; AltName: Full=Type-1 restriction enzyme EcoAI specificity subunit [Escherichia coli]AAA23987.1 EcoA type I restriction-modification enzyme S subunit [Escherichia coli]EFB2604524.1 restriction endonuclease subunit S [Escherichia coli]EFC1581171.1 restriction endonuclease subunit S [Esc